MERLNFSSKKMIAVIAGLFVLGISTGIMSVAVVRLHNIPAFSYITIIVLWAVSVQRRIVDQKMRHLILAACFFMVMLFFFRMCKYSYFPDYPYINTYMWYSYYIPMIMIPLCVFLAAMRIEPAGNKRTVMIIGSAVTVISIAMMVTVMTNEMHSLVYAITVHPDAEYTHMPFYYVIYAWRVGLAVASLLVFFIKCRFSPARKRWYIPVIFLVAGCFLLIWYLVNGGSPKIGGHKLFQLQEALCMPYILALESSIQIGMIPANSGYKSLFHNSDINACIYDRKDRPVLAAASWREMDADVDHRVCSEPISGGYVTWIEDISELNALNREMEEITEELRDENDLIQQENEVRSERVGFETRNRLYNRIATAVRTRAVRVNELLIKDPDGYDDEKDFRRDMIYASVLSAYIKRMGNLMIVTDGHTSVSSEELCLAIGESMEYLRLNGCVCDFFCEAEADLSSALALLAYELFEDAIEDVWLRLHTLSITIDCSGPFSLTIAMDTPAEAISSTWHDRQLEKAGGTLLVRYEDETYYIVLSSQEKKGEET